MRHLNASKKMTNKKTKKRKTTRRKKQSSWKKPTLIGFVCMLLVGAPIGGTAYLWSQGIIQDHISRVEQSSVNASMKAGFVLDEVFVHGRQETSREDILKALSVKRGQPIVDFDPVASREKIEALGWVESASVERKLPNHIIVKLKERVPAAIWQKGKWYSLIDSDGIEISEADVNRYNHLKVITGDDAPKHTMELLHIINQVPGLKKRVVGAAWVGDRRWTLHLDNKISIRLPADEAQKAWRKLSTLIEEHNLLNRDIELIDLRQPDRTIIRMTGSGAKRLLEDEENA